MAARRTKPQTSLAGPPSILPASAASTSYYTRTIQPPQSTSTSVPAGGNLHTPDREQIRVIRVSHIPAGPSAVLLPTRPTATMDSIKAVFWKPDPQAQVCSIAYRVERSRTSRPANSYARSGSATSSYGRTLASSIATSPTSGRSRTRPRSSSSMPTSGRSATRPRPSRPRRRPGSSRASSSGRGRPPSGW
jgi:hypothetical protein